jgi:hypothetical protein
MGDKKTKDLGIILRECLTNKNIPLITRYRFLLYELTTYPIREDMKNLRFGRFLQNNYEENKIIDTLSNTGLVRKGFSFSERRSTVLITRSGENLLGDYTPEEDLKRLGISGTLQ